MLSDTPKYQHWQYQATEFLDLILNDQHWYFQASEVFKQVQSTSAERTDQKPPTAEQNDTAGNRPEALY